MTLFIPLEFSAATHPGLKRDNNEDCFLSDPTSGLWLVADGMGGHEAGEVASAIVRDTIEKLVLQTGNFSLSEAIQTSHQTILSSAENGIGAVGMGSTVVVLFSRNKNYQIAWVGDSRAYLWTPSNDGGTLTRLTTDHSYVQMLFVAGTITAEEVESHPDKNIITQCLGMQELTRVNVDITQGQWQKNQWILLCSDGLTDELGDNAIAQILADNNDSQTAVDELLNKALKTGGHDNITVQIIESPLQGQGYSITHLWNWVPQISSSRKIDTILFSAAITSLIIVLVVILA